MFKRPYSNSKKKRKSKFIVIILLLSIPTMIGFIAFSEVSVEKKQTMIKLDNEQFFEKTQEYDDLFREEAQE